MDCQITDASLIDFHFAASTEEASARWESHLKTCPQCLGRYFAMKRAIDFSGQSDLRPSSTLRTNILGEFSRYSTVASRRWQPRARKWLIGGLAAAALIIGIMSYELAQEAVPVAAESIDAGGSQTAHSHIL